MDTRMLSVCYSRVRQLSTSITMKDGPHYYQHHGMDNLLLAAYCSRMAQVRTPKITMVDRVDMRICTRTPGYRPFVTSEWRCRGLQSQRCWVPIQWCAPNSFPIILCQSHHHHLQIQV